MSTGNPGESTKKGPITGESPNIFGVHEDPATEGVAGFSSATIERTSANKAIPIESFQGVQESPVDLKGAYDCLVLSYPFFRLFSFVLFFFLFFTDEGLL
jgi:hypothetical protein